MDSRKFLLLATVSGLIFVGKSIAFDGTNLLRHFGEIDSFVDQNNNPIEQFEQEEHEDVELVPELDPELDPEDMINRLFVAYRSLPEITEEVVLYDDVFWRYVSSSVSAADLTGLIEKEYTHENARNYGFSELQFSTSELIGVLAEASFYLYFDLLAPHFTNTSFACISIISIAIDQDLNYAVYWMLKHNGYHLDDNTLYTLLTKSLRLRKTGCLLSIIEYLTVTRHKQAELVELVDGINDEETALIYRTVLHQAGLIQF